VPAPYGQPRGQCQHDGFYFRVLLGPGYLLSWASPARSDSIKVRGLGIAFASAAGLAIRPNLALFVEYSATLVDDPTVAETGYRTAEATGTRATVLGFGGGAAYFSPGNLYLSGTLGASQLSFNDRGTGETLSKTSTRFGAALRGGLETWVSPEWAIGAGGQLTFASLGQSDADYRWTVLTVALLVSATYN
jgi:hypothetical protein